MGGIGKYSEEDVDLSTIEKQEVNTSENKGIFKKLASAFGFDVVEKGAVADKFKSKSQSTLFWNAWYSLQETLNRYNWTIDKYEFETDEDTIKEALQEFSEIVIDVLSEKSVTKALVLDMPIEKSGKKLSDENRETLQEIYNNLGKCLAGIEKNEEDEIDMTEVDIQKMIDKSIQKALENHKPAPPEGTDPVADTELTQDGIEKMITDAIQKALTPEEEAITAENIGEVIESAVQKAMEPVLKAKGLPKNLNGGAVVEKGEPHFMTGVF